MQTDIIAADRSRDSDCVHSLQVHIASQRLKVIFHDGRTLSYPVSTAKNGMDNRIDSFGTPVGWHRICARIGHGQPIGMVFRGREPTGEIATLVQEPLETGKDLITSRILWLDGLEEGVNKGGEVDSKGRYIYIHGTHEEGLIGSPVSHGCIRMKNSDIVALFDFVDVDCRVLVTERV